MSEIETLAPLIAASSREGFVAEQDSAFLVLYLEVGETKQDWSFKTETMSGRHIIVKSGKTADGVALAKDADRYQIFRLVKVAGSPWPNRISVGRARNNDVVLPDKSVSKLHAHFTHDDTGAPRLSDAGSRNGTRVNSERAPDSNPVPVASGDLLTFGAVSLTYLDAGGLHDLVSQLFVDL